MAAVVNFFSVDVEDYFQVKALQCVVRREDWEGYPLRVERNTRRILDLLDDCDARATFFVVGWVAAKCPDLVREIADRGHEVACHGHLHRCVYDMDPDTFREDTRQAKDVLEQVSGQEVLGYRAPTYSITRKTLWALDVLAELGFRYDSSIFPVHHDLYGFPGSPRTPYIHAGLDLAELPITTLPVAGWSLPVGGGGYFRLLPYRLTRAALSRINHREGRPFVFYVHPWELDPQQPRVSGLPLKSRVRHYLNLHKTAGRLAKLLTDFRFGPIGDRLLALDLEEVALDGPAA